jgi:KRAB domain-containing zinc finger protein
MKFIQKHHLQDHYRRKHTDERPFACNKCDRRFSTKRGAQQHRIAHTFAKPYACDVDGCEKKFTQKGNMLTHKRNVHEMVAGKYPCEQCNRACDTPDKLKTHRRIHTGERPYACTECAMKSGCKSVLQTHYRRKHTSERQYACAHCERTFATSSFKGYHQRRCIRHE